MVTHNGSSRALDIETLTVAAARVFGDDRVVTTETLEDAIDAATALVDEFDAGGEASGAGIVITGSVVTAGAARTLFGKDPA